MGHSFRFEPPALRAGLLSRARLVRALLGRWHHRVTALVGGPGLGKTTLLTQALAENRLAPRGEDVWLGLDAGDEDATTLARAVASALARSADGGPDGNPRDHERPADSPPVDPATAADAVWRRSPTQVCLVLDDAHSLPPGSPGAAWLGELIHRLPANGHVVAATRTSELPVPLGRLTALGEVLRLTEDDLRFDEDELASFALGRGLEPAHLRQSGGWPAIAELTAAVKARLTQTYLWEEVLEPLGADRRRVLAALCDLGGADDELASAALGRPVDVHRALDGVPLVAYDGGGWHVPHALWQDAGLGLDPAERTEILVRAVTHLVERERFDEAFRLIAQAELWDLAPTALRAACLASDRHRIGRLDRWLAACPQEVRDSPPGRLAAGMHIALTSPAGAIEPLRHAAEVCGAAGDVDAEMTAIAHLGRLAWYRQDTGVLSPALAQRVAELAATGNPRARALAAFGRAMVAEMAGDDATVLRELAEIESGVLDPGWEVMASWLHGVVRLGMGDAEAVIEMVERLSPTTDPALRTTLEGLRLRSWWVQGRIDEVLREAPVSIAAVRAIGVASHVHLAFTNASVIYSYTGQVAEARRCLDEGTAAAPPRRLPGERVRTALALASLQLAEGDEKAATATVQEALDASGLDRGIDRRGWRHMLPVSYVLVPETRSYWDERPLRGYLRVARQLAAAVVAVRAGNADEQLRGLDLPATGAIRSALHFRLAAELAIGLDAAGRPEGRTLLDALGPPGREAVRSQTTGTIATTGTAGPIGSSPLAKPAKGLLAAVPAPPPEPTYLAVLGPLTLRRGGPDGAEVDDPDLRRTRVRALLAFLVRHRSTTRTAINAALWPDLHERRPGNNLNVTLSYLLRVLEPWRAAGEAAYLVRLDGQNVQLVTGEHLRLDVDDFDRHLADAARAEDDGTPSSALEHYLAAIELYRGDLGADLPEDRLMGLEREHYRTRFVNAATRAGQLLLGHGDTDRAEEVARRTIAADPWAEEAHAILAAAALARGDRSAARRRLDHCLAVLDDLGVSPSETTLQLERRLRGGPVPA